MSLFWTNVVLFDKFLAKFSQNIFSQYLSQINFRIRHYIPQKSSHRSHPCLKTLQEKSIITEYNNNTSQSRAISTYIHKKARLSHLSSPRDRLIILSTTPALDSAVCLFCCRECACSAWHRPRDAHYPCVRFGARAPHIQPAHQKGNLLQIRQANIYTYMQDFRPFLRVSRSADIVVVYFFLVGSFLRSRRCLLVASDESSDKHWSPKRTFRIGATATVQCLLQSLVLFGFFFRRWKLVINRSELPEWTSIKLPRRAGHIIEAEKNFV